MLAQRALDRRLTEELLNFKKNIVTLTEELTEVKEHDRTLSCQALAAKTDVSMSLNPTPPLLTP